MSSMTSDDEAQTMNREKWVEENCACGISKETNKWSENVFDLFGCICEPDIQEEETTDE